MHTRVRVWVCIPGYAYPGMHTQVPTICRAGIIMDTLHTLTNSRTGMHTNVFELTMSLSWSLTKTLTLMALVHFVPGTRVHFDGTGWLPVCTRCVRCTRVPVGTILYPLTGFGTVDFYSRKKAYFTGTSQLPSPTPPLPRSSRMLERMRFHPPIVSRPLTIVCLQVLSTFREEFQRFDVFSGESASECSVCPAILPATLVQFVFVVVLRAHTDCRCCTSCLLFFFT